MTADKVSVLITLYNHENYIGEALESAFAQTRPPDEAVVIDDHSTDRSVEVARRFLRPGVRIIEQPHNLGGATTVKGLLACSGAYIAILNSDDRWHREKLERQIDYLRTHPRCGAVFTYPELIDESGKNWKAGEHYLHRTFQAENRSRAKWLRHFFDHGNAFCASSAVVRSECFARLGPLDGRYVQLQDFEMWLRIVAAGYDIHVVAQPLTFYRVARRRSNLSSTSLSVRARETYEYSLLLRNFWRIQTMNELSEIFPEEASWLRADNRLVKFCLARIAAARPATHHQQFAVDTMFEAAGDRECIELAAKEFGFTHVHYRDFIARNPLGLSAEGDVSRRAAMFLASRMPQGLLQLLRRTKRRILGRPETNSRRV